MSYKQHIAFYHRGDWRDSYICGCDRKKDHERGRELYADVIPLFDLAPNGEIA